MERRVTFLRFPGAPGDDRRELFTRPGRSDGPAEVAGATGARLVVSRIGEGGPNAPRLGPTRPLGGGGVARGGTGQCRLAALVIESPFVKELEQPETERVEAGDVRAEPFGLRSGRPDVRRAAGAFPGALFRAFFTVRRHLGGGPPPTGSDPGTGRVPLADRPVETQRDTIEMTARRRPESRHDAQQAAAGAAQIPPSSAVGRSDDQAEDLVGLREPTVQVAAPVSFRPKPSAVSSHQAVYVMNAPVTYDQNVPEERIPGGNVHEQLVAVGEDRLHARSRQGDEIPTGGEVGSELVDPLTGAGLRARGLPRHAQ